LPGKIAIEQHFVTPGLEDLVLNPGWPEDAFRRTLLGPTRASAWRRRRTRCV